MAYVIKKINPLDLKPSVAIGVSLPFNGPAVFNSTYQTKDQVRSNLINFFLTSRGERLFNPTFGSGLREKIFEIINGGMIDDIQDVINDAMENYFPDIKVEKINVTSNPDEHVLYISLVYSLLSNGIEDELTLTFNNNIQ